jgi:hypothetical protein
MAVGLVAAVAELAAVAAVAVAVDEEAIDPGYVLVLVHTAYKEPPCRKMDGHIRVVHLLVLVGKSEKCHPIPESRAVIAGRQHNHPRWRVRPKTVPSCTTA